MSRKLRVGVLFGGKSAEHEVSLQSAKNVVNALNRDKYEVVLIGIGKDGRWHLHDESAYLLNETNPKLISLNRAVDALYVAPGVASTSLVRAETRGAMEGLDVAFPVLHGTNGEDGTVQGLLKLLDIPFVGPSILGSSVGMDKDVMKRLLRDAGIPIGKFLVLHSGSSPIPSFESATKLLGAPLFVKPANAGSSVGVSKARSESEFKMAIEEAFRFDRKILVEEYIKGREVECAVLGNDEPIASVLGEIIPHHDFYSYEAKYIDEKGAGLEIPAKVSPETQREAQKLAIETFRALCCEGMGRVDMFLTEDGRLYVNEINTIPGFTKISMYPKLWAASGISYEELIERLLTLAIERHRREIQLSTSYAEDNA